MKTELTIVTVAENDSGLINLMIASVYKFTSPKPKIIICDNGGNRNLLDMYSSDPDIRIIKHKPTMPGGSNRHGQSLSRVIRDIDTPRAAIVESDCIVLAKGWDNMDDKYDVSASVKHISAGKKYYYAAFLLFKTTALAGMDFRPGTDRSRSHRSYGPHEDVIWRLADTVDVDKIDVMSCVDCKSGRGQYLDKTFQSEEYWVSGKPVVMHFGRGSNLAGKAARKGFDNNKVQLQRFKLVAEGLL